MIEPRLTAARRAWLQRLHDEKVAKRQRSRVGYDCMHLGWTEWDYIGIADPRRHYTTLEARAEFGDQWWDNVIIAGERLTPVGEAVLREYNERSK